MAGVEGEEEGARPAQAACVQGSLRGLAGRSGETASQKARPEPRSRPHLLVCSACSQPHPAGCCLRGSCCLKRTLQPRQADTDLFCALPICALVHSADPSAIGTAGEPWEPTLRLWVPGLVLPCCCRTESHPRKQVCGDCVRLGLGRPGARVGTLSGSRGSVLASRALPPAPAEKIHSVLFCLARKVRACPWRWVSKILLSPCPILFGACLNFY